MQDESDGLEQRLSDPRVFLTRSLPESNEPSLEPAGSPSPGPCSASAAGLLLTQARPQACAFTGKLLAGLCRGRADPTRTAARAGEATTAAQLGLACGPQRPRPRGSPPSVTLREAPRGSGRRRHGPRRRPVAVIRVIMAFTGITQAAK